MFTGIIETIGKIQSVTPTGQDGNAGVHLAISAETDVLEKIAIGDSVAVNGACMTVVAKRETGFEVDVSPRGFRIKPPAWTQQVRSIWKPHWP